MPVGISAPVRSTAPQVQSHSAPRRADQGRPSVQRQSALRAQLASSRAVASRHRRRINIPCGASIRGRARGGGFAPPADAGRCNVCTSHASSAGSGIGKK